MMANGDTEENNEGIALKQWCQDHGLSILNLTIKCRGKFSRVEPNPNAVPPRVERSTIDYAIISDELLGCGGAAHY